MPDIGPCRVGHSPTYKDAMLGITRLDHVSVIVTDVARSRAFYRDVLGLAEIAPPKEFDFVTLWFALSDGQTLHLLQKPTADTLSSTCAVSRGRGQTG